MLNKFGRFVSRTITRVVDWYWKYIRQEDDWLNVRTNLGINPGIAIRAAGLTALVVTCGNRTFVIDEYHVQENHKKKFRRILRRKWRGKHAVWEDDMDKQQTSNKQQV